MLESQTGANLLVNGSEVDVPSLTLDANEVLAIASIKRAAALTRATAYDLTLDAHSGYKPTGEIRFTSDSSTAEYSFNPGKNNQVNTVRAGDFANMTIDGLTVSVTIAAASSGTTANQDIINKLTTKWTSQYGTTGAASASYSLFTVGSTTSKITIAAKSGSGRRGFDKSYSIVVIPATTVGASTTLNLEYGGTSSGSDNNTISNGIIVTLESNIAGVLLDAVAGASVVRGKGQAASVTLLTTTNKPVANVATTTTKNIYPEDARGDAVNPESAVTEVATAATSTDRTAWL